MTVKIKRDGLGEEGEGGEGGERGKVSPSLGKEKGGEGGEGKGNGGLNLYPVVEYPLLKSIGWTLASLLLWLLLL